MPPPTSTPPLRDLSMEQHCVTGAHGKTVCTEIRKLPSEPTGPTVIATILVVAILIAAAIWGLRRALRS